MSKKFTLSPSYFAKIIVIAALYFILGGLGLHLALQQATPVWVPSGMVMAAVLIYGYRIFPAILLGSALLNTWYTFASNTILVSIVGSCTIALGSTLSALFGGYLVNRYANGAEALNRVRDTTLFILFASALSPVIAASVGTAVAVLSGNVPANSIVGFWMAWWEGDATGIIMFTPPLLIWSKWTKWEFQPWHYFEAFLLFGLLLLVGYFTFWMGYPLAYVLLLFLMWAVFRLGYEAASLATLVILGMAIWGTIQGLGPFVTGNRVESLLLLSSFIAVISITSMIFSATLKERQQRTVDLLAAMKESMEAHKKEDAANRANKAKSIFLATMSQEFYAPLDHIVANSDLVMEKVVALPVGQNLTANLNADLQKIKDSGVQLRDMIINILELSKLEIGNLELDLTNFNLTEAINEVWETIQIFKIKEDITFVINLDVRLGNMFSDRNKVCRILHNGLENARRFTPVGVVSLEVERKSIKERDWIIFTIACSGIDIGQEYIDKIIESFVRGDSSSEFQYGGAGLGLAINKQLCKMLEGDIAISRIQKKGLTLTIQLPANIQYLGLLTMT